MAAMSIATHGPVTESTLRPTVEAGTTRGMVCRPLAKPSNLHSDRLRIVRDVPQGRQVWFAEVGFSAD